jgi:hypothetical protein
MRCALTEQDMTNELGTCQLLEQVVQAKVEGASVLGTIGEFVSLSRAVRANFIWLCCQAVDRHGPLLIGITNMPITTTIKMAMIVKELGAFAVVLTDPFYFPLEQIQHYMEPLPPAQILCVVPWVKMFSLLPHPMHWAQSQYDMKLSFVGKGNTTNLYGKAIPTFDKDSVRNDIAALGETGVLQDWTKVDFDDFFGLPLRKEAWRTYLNSGLSAPAAMGLYALQLEPIWGLPNDFFAICNKDLQ